MTKPSEHYAEITEKGEVLTRLEKLRNSFGPDGWLLCPGSRQFIAVVDCFKEELDERDREIERGIKKIEEDVWAHVGEELTKLRAELSDIHGKVAQFSILQSLEPEHIRRRVLEEMEKLDGRHTTNSGGNP